MNHFQKAEHEGDKIAKHIFTTILNKHIERQPLQSSYDFYMPSTNTPIEVKKRNVKSTTYDDIMIEKMKTDNILKDHDHFIFLSIFTDNRSYIWKVTKEIIMQSDEVETRKSYIPSTTVASHTKSSDLCHFFKIENGMMIHNS